MQRNLTVLITLLLGLAFTPLAANAHGGRPPPGCEPGRPPGPDTNPPTPPPPPTSGEADPAAHGGSAPGQPVPAAPTPITGPGSLPGTDAPAAATLPSQDDWTFWYEYNRDDIENLKRAIYERITTSNPLSVIGGSSANRSDATHAARAATERILCPLMRDVLLGGKERPHYDVEASALIALAKMSRDPTDVDRLISALAPGGHAVAREAAALGLGILRRSTPSEQFTAGDLDGVRDRLFELLANRKEAGRLRCFCAYAIGLLGDQPTGSQTGIPRDARSTTAQLFELLQRSEAHAEVPVAMLTAIGLQDPTTVTSLQRETLRTAALRRRLAGSEAGGLIPSEAAAALGRVGHAEDASALLRILTDRRSDSQTQNASAIALGRLARAMSSEGRVDLASRLVAALGKVRNRQARTFGLISLAYIVNADLQAESTDVLRKTPASALLLKTSRQGRALERPYAAIALALICRQMGTDPKGRELERFADRATTALRKGAGARSKLSARGRSAFVLGLGLARDAASLPLLKALVADKDAPEEIVGNAALALGLSSAAQGHRDATRSIRRRLLMTRSEYLKQRCATALALLRDRGAVPMLARELRAAKTLATTAQLALALARLGDERAMRPLVELARAPDTSDMTRALVVAALGVIGDMEPTASLSRITKDINYRAMNDSRREVVTIL